MFFPSSLERNQRRTEWRLIMNISELFDLHGRTVLITGGSGVLGRVMASGLAQAGARVAVLGRREEPALAVAATIRAAGGEAIGVQPHLAVDNSDVAPTRLTGHCDAPYAKETLPATHFKHRGSVCPFMCTCSCSWSVSCSLWRGSGVLTCSIFDLAPHEDEPSVAYSTVCSSPAAQTIAPPVVSPPLSHQVESQRQRLYAPGVR